MNAHRAAKQAGLFTRACARLCALALSLSATASLAQSATTTVLTSATNPVVIGQSSVLIATVTPATASGTVTFRDATTTIGTAPLSAGVARLTRTFTATGTRSLTAVYAGGGGHTASTSAAVAQVISKATTTTTISSSANPATAGGLSLTATITGYIPAGTVTFRNGSATLGSATAANGVATLSVPSLPLGTHSLSAAYAGNTHNNPSTSAVLLQAIHGAALPPAPVASAPVVHYEYDPNGNATRTIQAKDTPGLNLHSVNTYDGLNRLKDSTDPRQGKTSFAYNGRDDLQQVTDPRQLITHTPRNGLGEATQLISPDTGTDSRTHDTAGNLKTRTDSRGVLSTHTYDVLNRLTRSVHSKTGLSTQTYNWSYDQAGSGYAHGIGRLTSTSHPSGSTQYTYDPQGRVLTDTQRISAATGANTSQIAKTVSYTYDAAGKLTALHYPSGRKLTLSYSQGQLSALGLGANATASPGPLLGNIQFEPFGAIKSWQWHLGSSTQPSARTHDHSGRLIRYRLGPVMRDVSYDAADRITAYTHHDILTAAPQPSLDQSFGYDENGRITRITTATATWSIGYDANGNRTSVTLNGTPSAYTTEAGSNRLSSTTHPARSFGYDSAGHTTSDSANYSATYDAAGRLHTLTKAGVTTTYSYDGFGRRVRKFSSTGAASTVVFVYDHNGQLLGEYGPTGTPIREYVWLGNTPVAVFVPSGSTQALYYLHTDHLNTPRIATDTAGNIRWRWMAEPFGSSIAEDNPAGLGVLTQNLRFPGQYFDSESGLHYNWHRYLDPQNGRYTQSDPVGLVGGLNTYAYVSGNPLIYFDPNGLWAWGDPLPQDMVDFSAGWGDTLSFGLTNQARELMDTNGVVHRCSASYRGGEVFGFANGMAIGWAQGTKAAARAASPNNWSNFSHSLFPRQWLSRSQNPVARWMNRTGNRMNGDHIPAGPRPDLHDLMDGVAAGVGGSYRTWPAWRRLMNRMPFVPGSAMYGAASAAMNECGCEK